MASYQDIDSRLRSVEDKLEFVMKQFTISKTVGRIAPKVVTKTLLDLYYEIKAVGAAVSFAESQADRDAAQWDNEVSSGSHADGYRDPDPGLPAPSQTEVAPNGGDRAANPS